MRAAVVQAHDVRAAVQRRRLAARRAQRLAHRGREAALPAVPARAEVAERRADLGQRRLHAHGQAHAPQPRVAPRQRRAHGLDGDAARRRELLEVVVRQVLDRLREPRDRDLVPGFFEISADGSRAPAEVVAPVRGEPREPRRRRRRRRAGPELAPRALGRDPVLRAEGPRGVEERVEVDDHGPGEGQPAAPAREEPAPQARGPRVLAVLGLAVARRLGAVRLPERGRAGGPRERAEGAHRLRHVAVARLVVGVVPQLPAVALQQGAPDLLAPAEQAPRVAGAQEVAHVARVRVAQHAPQQDVAI